MSTPVTGTSCRVWFPADAPLSADYLRSLCSTCQRPMSEHVGPSAAQPPNKYLKAANGQALPVRPVKQETPTSAAAASAAAAAAAGPSVGSRRSRSLAALDADGDDHKESDVDGIPVHRIAEIDAQHAAAEALNVEEEDLNTTAAVDEQSGAGNGVALVSLQQVKDHLGKLLDFLNRTDLPLHLASFALLVRALRDRSFDSVIRVGFLGESNMGKSFLIDALLRSTAHDAHEYGMRTFRAGVVNELEYLLRLEKLGRPLSSADRDAITRIRLIDGLKDGSENAKQLLTDVHEQRAEFEKNLKNAFDRRQERPHTINFDPVTAWLLPSSTTTAPTTSVTIRLHYGRTFHMLLRYKKEEQMREAAMAWLALDPTERRSARQLEEQWKHFVGSDRPNWKPTDDKPLELSAAALEYAGRCELFEGVGHSAVGVSSQQNFDLDREWLRLQLNAIMSSDMLRSYALDTLDVFVPCRMLDMGCELLDIPGCNDPHLTEMVREQVQECHQLFLLTRASPDRNQILVDTIASSGFMENLLRNDPDKIREIHVIGYLERYLGARVLNDTPNVVSAREKDVKEMKDGVRKWLTRAYPDDAEKLEKRIPVYFAEPVTFMALLLQQQQTPGKEEISAEAMWQKQKDSNVLRIINTVASIPRKRAQMTIAALLEEAEDALAAGAAAAAGSSTIASAPAPTFSGTAGGGVMSRVSGLIPRLVSLLEDELSGVDSDVQHELLAKLSRLASTMLQQKKLFISQLDNALEAVGADTARTEWSERFASAADAVLQSDSVGFPAAVAVAKHEGVKRFQSEGSKRLTGNNIHVSLHPSHRGNRAPLCLRELLYRHFAQNPLNSVAIINELRAHMVELPQHTATLQQLVLNKLMRNLAHTLTEQHSSSSRSAAAVESLLQHGSVQRAVARAVTAAQSQVRADLETLFSERLTPDDLYVLCDKAFRKNLTSWLTEHRAEFWAAGSLDKLREAVRDALPKVFDDFKVALQNQLCDVANARIKKMYWALFDKRKTQSAIRLIASRLMQELAALVPQEAAAASSAMEIDSAAVETVAAQEEPDARSEQLSNMLSFLHKWRVDAEQLLPSRAGDSESDAELEVLHSYILQLTLFAKLSQNLVAKREALINAVRLRHKQLLGAKALQPNLHHYQRWTKRLNKSRSSSKSSRGKAEHAIVNASIEALRLMQQNTHSPAQVDQQLLALNRRCGLSFKHSESPFSIMLRGWGLQIAEVPPDGDCLFTALAHQLRWSATDAADAPTAAGNLGAVAAAGPGGGRRRAEQPSIVGDLADIVLNPSTLREITVSHMRVLFIHDSDFALKYGDTLEKYCARMMRDGSWGGEPELVALANALNMQILVWQQTGDVPLLFAPQQTHRTLPAHRMPTLQIGAVNSQYRKDGPINHFVSLVETNGERATATAATATTAATAAPNSAISAGTRSRSQDYMALARAWLHRRRFDKPEVQLVSLLQRIQSAAARTRKLYRFDCGHPCLLPAEVWSKELGADRTWCPFCIAHILNISEDHWKAKGQ